MKEYSQRLAKEQSSKRSLASDDPSEGLVKNLWRLIDFLDEVLIEEWSSKHASFKCLNPTGEPEEYQYCDFCGADIFQSCFACPKCANDELEEFTCCPACYVEGRSCVCGPEYMEPYQTWPFEYLIHQRNSAANVLNTCLELDKQLLPVTDDTIEEATHLKVFQAACLLRDRARQRMKVLQNVYHFAFALLITL